MLLTGWLNGSHHMPFAVPMVWGEPKDCTTNCYFCTTKTSVITAKTRCNVKYPDISSAIRPVLHSPELPIPMPSEIWNLYKDEVVINVEPNTNQTQASNSNSDTTRNMERR